MLRQNPPTSVGIHAINMVAMETGSKLQLNLLWRHACCKYFFYNPPRVRVRYRRQSSRKSVSVMTAAFDAVDGSPPMAAQCVNLR